MSNTTAATRSVIRASVREIAKAAEFLSLIFDAPVVITAASDEVSAPSEHHLVMTSRRQPHADPRGAVRL